MSRNEIVGEPYNCSVTQIDPELVELFLDVIEENRVNCD